MPEPLPLRVSSAPDLAQQQHMHRLTALSRALHGSHTVMPLRAAQPAPNAPQRGNTAGSSEAARLEALKAELETRHWRLSRARNVGSVADIVAADAAITALEARLTALARELSAVDGGRSAPAGRPNLYAVTVPALEVSGHLPATYAAERWTLDTHTLPGELRDRLGAYLLSGSEAPPYRYKRTRARYWPNQECPEEDRSLLVELAKWKVRAAIPPEKNAPLVSV